MKMDQKNKLRHPEKINNPINPIKKKPAWIRTKILDTQNYFKTKEIINKKNCIQFVKKLTVQIFLNVGEKNMLPS